MTRIEGEIVIARPVEAVFDYVADERNEPRYNPHVICAQKLTDGPVGVGTVFRAGVSFLGGTTPLRITYTGYRRPSLLASSSTMRAADFEMTLAFEPVPAGTLMRWSEQVRPKGGLRLLTPVIVRLGRRRERANWTSMKNRLEAPVPADDYGGTATPARPAAGNGAVEG